MAHVNPHTYQLGKTHALAKKRKTLHKLENFTVLGYEALAYSIQNTVAKSSAKVKRQKLGGESNPHQVFCRHLQYLYAT